MQKINEPINNILWVPVEELKPNNYNPNHVFKNELKLLKYSINKNGWLHPIIINQDNIIIDGYHRATITRTDPEIYERTGGRVPCIRIKTTPDEMKLLTIRINRTRGTHTAAKMAEIIQGLTTTENKKYIQKEIGATREEINLLLLKNLFEKEGINDETLYSQAWEPLQKKMNKKELKKNVF